MSKYILTEGHTEHAHVAFERFLFNEGRHLRTQAHEGWVTFEWVDAAQQLIAARVHFHIDGEQASSPLRAPFGSVEFADDLSPENLLRFLLEVEKRLKALGVRRVLLRDAPQLYRPQNAALLTVLLGDMGFAVRRNEICASIVVDQTPWENKISKDELYHLHRAQREELVFHELESSRWREVYEFIDRCRQERGMALSMTSSQLQDTLVACPQDFLFFDVCKGDERIAAAISVRVSPRILYNFYYGHSKSSNALSPVVYLLQCQYAYCQQHGYQILDLGTSSLEDKTNFSLLNFKTEVGGVLSMKLTFEKEF